MPNQVRTDFIINEGNSFKKIDAYQDKLNSLEKPAATLGDSVDNATSKIGAGFDKATASVKNFGDTVNKNFAQPTISKWYENEADKVHDAVNRIEADQKRIGYQSVGFKSDDSGKVTDTGALLNRPKNNDYKYDPSKPSPNEFGFKIDYSDSETIAGAKRVKDSIEKIGEATEKTAAKLNLIRGFGPVFRELGLEINETEINVAITGVNKLNEYLAKNAAAKLAGATATTTLSATEATAATAQAGLAATTTTATAALAAEGTAAAAAGTATTAAFASVGAALTAVAAPLALAAAGAAIVYHVTSDIRAEAERRLEVENKISFAYGQQVSSGRELLRQFHEQQSNDERGRNFTSSLTGLSLEALTNRKKTIDALIEATPARISPVGAPDTETDKYFKNESDQLKRESSELAKQIDDFKQNKIKADNLAFNSAGENEIKSREQADKFQADRAKERNADIEKTSNEILKFKSDLTETLTSSESKTNPFVKLMSDFETATDRAREKYKDLTKAVGSTELADKFAAADRANIQKEINLKNFENRFDALGLRQKAQQLAATPENQFADFKRALERVEFKTDSLAKIFELNKKIDEADYYASKYNPNNPQSFEDSRFSFAERDRFAEIAGDRRRGESLVDYNKRRSEAVDIGIRTEDAKKAVDFFKSFSEEGTGILGKSAIADKILEAIPKREDLLKQLNSPYAATREDAQFLLQQQSDALRVKRDAEEQKLKDFLENQKFQEFGKKFAREQIEFINNDRNLTDTQKAQKRLAVTDALGNDLDAGLKNQRIQDFLIAAREKDNQIKEGIQIARDSRALLGGILKAVAGGMTLDPATLAALNNALQITITNQSDADAAIKQQTKTPTHAATKRYYDEASGDSAYRIGDAHDAGELYGSKLY